jgi:amidase
VACSWCKQIQILKLYVGGSIRAPSAFNGIYGLKPSVGRLPHGGLEGLHDGMENVIGVCGPMATCIEDMRLFCKVILAAEPWRQEPELIGKPWTPISAPANMKIGVIWHDGVAQPHPPVTRCLQETVRALQEAGHTIVDWDPKDHRELIRCIDKAFLIDAGKEFWEVLAKGQEPAVHVIERILTERAPIVPLQVSDTWKVIWSCPRKKLWKSSSNS